MREERSLKVFDNGALRRIFGPMREVTWEWRRLRNEELNYLYCSPNIIRVIKIKKNELGRTFRSYETEERCIQGFGGLT